MLRILLVDDHPLVMFASQVLLEKSGFKVVGSAENGIDALKLTRLLRPDLIILDIGLPGFDGFQVIAQLRTQLKPPKILVMTTQGTDHFAQCCHQAGANGFITKTDGLCYLLDAVKTLSRGYNYFPPTKNLAAQPTPADPSDASLMAALSKREMSVLVGLASGLSNKDISIQLILSEKTVSTYKQRLKKKLNARSIIDLTDFARRNKLLE